MNEKEKIQQQLTELTNAGAALLRLRPPDTEGFDRLETRVGDLLFRLAALTNAPVLRQLTVEEVARLQGAVQILQTAVVVSAGATQIMQAATTLLNA